MDSNLDGNEAQNPKRDSASAVGAVEKATWTSNVGGEEAGGPELHFNIGGEEAEEPELHFNIGSEEAGGPDPDFSIGGGCWPNGAMPKGTLTDIAQRRPSAVRT